MQSSIPWKDVQRGMKASQKKNWTALNRIVEPMVDGILSRNAAYAAAEAKEKMEIRATALNAVKHKIEKNNLMVNDKYSMKVGGIVYSIPAIMSGALIAMMGVAGGFDMAFVGGLFGFGLVTVTFSALVYINLRELPRIRKAFELFAKELEMIINNAVNPPAPGLGSGAKEYQGGQEYQRGDFKNFGRGSDFGDEYSFLRPKPRKFYTDVLGVEENASKERIKEAHRRRSVETHPDKHGGDDSEFKRVQNAYEHLNGRKN